MAEFTAVGLGTRSPDVAGKLSALLSIKSQQQALRGQAAEVAGAEQTQRQRAGLSQYMQTQMGKHIGEDGTIDLNSIANDAELANAAGDQYVDTLGKLAEVKNAQLSARRTLAALRGDQRAAFGEIVGGLRSNKDVLEGNEKGRQLVNQAMEQFGTMYGEDALPVLRAYAAPLQRSQNLADTLKSVQQQAMSVDSQATAQQPHFVDTGKKLEDVSTGSAPTASLEKTVPPGAVILKDLAGTQFVLDPTTNRVTQVGGGGPAKASPQEFKQPTYVGQEKDIESAQKDVQNIRTAADRAPTNRNIYKHILELADDTSTGQLVSFFQRNPVIGQIAGDNYQELNKFLTKQAIENMQAMGGASDSRLEAASAANGSGSFNPQALKAVTKFNYATNTGLEMFRAGIDKAIGTTNPDYTKLPAFRSEWAKNFDVNALILDNAQKDGDTGTFNALIDHLTPEQAKELLQKRKNLHKLAKDGAL